MGQARRRLSEQERQERRRRDRERLEHATAELLSSEGWRRWLRTRSVLHGYSLIISRFACRNRWGERCRRRRHVVDGVGLRCRLWRRPGRVVGVRVRSPVLVRPSVGRAGSASTPAGFPAFGRVTPAPVRGR